MRLALAYVCFVFGLAGAATLIRYALGEHPPASPALVGMFWLGAAVGGVTATCLVASLALLWSEKP